jgi:hypothetical protein
MVNGRDALAGRDQVAADPGRLQPDGHVVVAARASSRGRLNGEPISSSGEQTRVMAAKSSNPARSQRTSTASNPHTTPALSSVTPGP